MDWFFDDHGGQTAPQGKPTWPDRLTIEINKTRALQLARDILAKFDDDNTHIDIVLVGKLEQGQ